MSKAPARSTGWQGDEPARTCHGCGEKIVLKHGPVWFQRYAGGAADIKTWHMRCRPRGGGS